MPDIIANICLYGGIFGLCVFIVLPHIRVMKQRIPNRCRRHLVSVGGYLGATILLSVTVTIQTGLILGLIFLGFSIIIYAILAIFYIFYCP